MRAFSYVQLWFEVLVAIEGRMEESRTNGPRVRVEKPTVPQYHMSMDIQAETIASREPKH